jgi:hypothetical protein
MMEIEEVAKYLPEYKNKQLPDHEFFFRVSDVANE